MNRQNFDNKWRAVVHSQAEMDRKWRVFIREQEDMMMSQRAVASSAPAAGPITETPVNNEPASMHFFVNASDNIAFVVMNYSLGTISEPYDTGISYNSGSSYLQTSLQNIQDGGFMPVIYDSVNARNYAFFVTSQGVVVDQIFTGGGYQSAELNEYMTFFIDYDPDGSPTYGILKMFDGTKVTTLTLDGVTNLNWGYGTGSVTSDRTVLFDFNSTGNFNLVTKSGNVTQIHVSVPESRPEFYLNWTHDYVCGIFYDETNANLHHTFKVWDEGGSLLQTIDISGFGVDQVISGSLYGADGRFCVVLGNSVDANVDYLVIHYDRKTNTTITDTHERGINFPNMSAYITDLEMWNPSNAMKTNALINFYKDGAHTTATGFNSAEFFDVWCMHHDLQTFTKTSLVTSDEIGYMMSTNQEEGAIYSGDPVLLYYDVTDGTLGEVKVASFTGSGFVSFSLGIDSSDLNNISAIECIAPSHAFFWYELISNSGIRNWVIFNSAGTAIETHQTSDATSNGGGPMYDALIVLDLNDYTNCFSFSPSRGLEILPDPSPNTYGVLAYNDIENEFGTNSGYSTRNVILQTFSPDNNPIGFAIYNNESGLQSYVELPAYVANHSFLMGESVVFFSYNASETSKFSAALYAIQTGELLNISEVPLNEYPSSSVNYGDRIWNTLDDANIIYFHSRSGMVSFDLGPTPISNSYNDAYWIAD